MAAPLLAEGFTAKLEIYQKSTLATSWPLFRFLKTGLLITPFNTPRIFERSPGSIEQTLDLR
jgi:hypothetical protein